tara:strand:- start:21483 stop:22424 length:942 start_codon:yes stop_codon:yes gene_type:complete
VKCLVTGATGFIGRELCHALVQRGDAVVALSRRGESLPEIGQTLAHDLAENPLPAHLFDGIDTVFHLAGVAHQRAPAEAYEQINVQATKQLAKQAASAGVRCFVYLSSVKAMGAALNDDVRDESDQQPAADEYGRSKAGAENALRGAIVESAMSTIILRPALVFGPGAKGNLHLLERVARSALPRPPQAGRRSMLVMGDLVELMLLLADNPPEGCHTWIACHEEACSARDIYDAMRVAAGKSPGKSWLPDWCWYSLLAALDGITGRAGNGLRQRLFDDERYTSAALSAATGWRAKTPPLQAISGTILPSEAPP